MRFTSAFTQPKNISQSLDRHHCRFWGSHIHQDLSHSHQQLSHLRNKIVILHYHLMCSDSSVVTSRYYCLLPVLSFSSILILYTLIIWLCYRGPWYSHYSHNHPWFIKKYRVFYKYWVFYEKHFPLQLLCIMK